MRSVCIIVKQVPCVLFGMEYHKTIFGQENSVESLKVSFDDLELHPIVRFDTASNKL